MTDAGWTAWKDVKEKGFYWLMWDGKEPQIVQVRGASVHFTSGLTMSIEEVNGQFKGPLSPTDRQQGRVEGLREASDIADEHICQTWSECCDCGGEIRKEIGALIAQDEKGVGDV